MIVNIENALRRATVAPRYALDGWIYRHSHQPSRLLHLKNAYKGKPILVVGNGPSLNRTPLDAFTDAPSIGMNKIDLIFEKTKWRPSLIVCQNSIVARQHACAYAASSIPIYIAFKARYFLPKKTRKKFHWFHLFASGAFSIDASRGVGAGHTVTYAALQFAYYMGASPVVLIGVDHSFRFTGTPLHYQRSVSFDENHFDPNYFKEGQLWGLPDLEGSESDYRRARLAFERDDRRILDATVDGKLRVFEKISIEKAIDICNS